MSTNQMASCGDVHPWTQSPLPKPGCWRRPETIPDPWLTGGPSGSGSSNSKGEVKLWIKPSGADVGARVLGFPSPTHFTAFAESPHSDSTHTRVSGAVAARLTLLPNVGSSQMSKPQLICGLCFNGSEITQPL